MTSKTKLTVTREGRVIGTRTTHRPYTHVVAMLGYDAKRHAQLLEASRTHPNVEAQYRRNWADEQRISQLQLGDLADGKTSWYTVDQYMLDRAQAFIAKHPSADQYVATMQALSIEEDRKRLQRAAAQGDYVLSWHGSLALAQKAARAIDQQYCFHTPAILAVDA